MTFSALFLTIIVWASLAASAVSVIGLSYLWWRDAKGKLLW